MIKLMFLILFIFDCRLFAGVLKLDVGEEAWPPYSFYRDQTHKGIMVEVLENLIADEDLELKISFLPELRASRELEHCNVDAKPKAIEWIDHPKKYLWSDPVVISQDIVVARKGNTFTTKGQLNGKIIGTVRGYSYPTLDKNFRDQTMQRADASSTLKMLEMLAKGHTDAAITNLHVFKWYLKNQPELAINLVSTKVIIDQAPYRFQFCSSKEWRELMPRINKKIGQLKNSGELDNIIKRYQ